MPIYDTDGTVNYEISKIYNNDGTTNHQIGKVYDNDGTTNFLIYNLQSENITLKVDGDSHSGSIEWHSATYTNSEGYTQLTIVSATVNSCNYGSNRAQLKIGSTNVQDTGKKDYAAFKTAVSDWAGASHSIANGDVITLTGYSKRDANRDDGADNITITMVFYLS